MASAEDERAHGFSCVNSFTEWDPLREVVVGTLEGAVFPTWQGTMAETIPVGAWEAFQNQGGSPFPEDQLKAAQHELDNFVSVLENEGIVVRRPDPVAYDRPFSTPGWESPGGLYAAMPRDCLIVAGNTIIEAPMSWRCRYYETDAYRSLIKAYFHQGARWISAPKPQLTDALWQPAGRGDGEWAITEFEPVFDAADFMRFGRDIVVQQSHVTNQFGINWMRSVLGPEFRIHCIDVNDPHAMHIDATLMPLAPGRLLVNPERFVPGKLFDGWEIRPAPAPALPKSWPMYFCSPWVSMNLLSLGPDTVVVEAHETQLLESLTEWGFRCIPVDFWNVYSFGGSFHCVTLDVKREGTADSYLSADFHG